ncbi:TetR/AcrR family transcriptional regulator [Psychrobium sp. 1_MG-2023]|uniref:TetR/AcrR family transcriptional regulator n=1 Tax=Psychrobium sp. 1_MG-2023 TaxID=3062624 RepID=UPI000C3317EE|nr:TetR/AcrR family transcriptional regulator [Psychrobium sp. 1_MG-2023]MDP2560501.1 TetR/AcrR family transcriptional regulator [Psychrobium sp. 1_MG-2023]PKF55197.1 hypothetical protein CW748_13990 [Alteromonadales bacterium alter-6D02]
MAYRATDKTRAHMAKQRLKLLTAAQEIVSKGGFKALTIVNIATHSGLAVGSVYKHFKSKDFLLEQVYRELTDQDLLLDVPQIRVSLEAKEQLKTALEQFFARALMADKLAYALFSEPITPHIELIRRQFKKQFSQVFIEIIELGIEQNIFQAQDPSLSANAIVGILVESLLIPLHWEHQNMPTFERINLIQQCQQFCLRAIAFSGDESTFFE